MTNASVPLSNIPEFSVGELAGALKKTIEQTYGRVRVRGELSRVSIAGSGHMYSAIKDDNAVIDAVCWKGTMNKLSIRPEEGLEVICTGRLTTYPARSNYQLVIESMELAGEGALLKMLEERKKRLAAEGLFDPAHKKPLPFLPEVIGVVTSPTGAVIRDIMHRLNDRFPRHVLLWPALVQGERAAEQVSAAIKGFQTIDQHGLPKPDVLIVARGGGSLEDLMPFNEENVIRAVFESDIPVISAVGHETDTTLIDYVSDARAPTPTGAAEIAVPVRANLHAQILDNEKRLINASSRLFNEYGHKLSAAAAKLASPERILETHTQRIDHLGTELKNGLRHITARKTQRLIETYARLRRPHDTLKQAHISLSRWQEQLTRAGENLIEPKCRMLEHTEKMLEAYSFENILNRGFAVIRDKDGRVLTTADKAHKAKAFQIQFKNQETVDVHTSNDQLTTKPKLKRKPDTKTEQTSLF